MLHRRFEALWKLSLKREIQIGKNNKNKAKKSALYGWDGYVIPIDDYVLFLNLIFDKGFTEKDSYKNNYLNSYCIINENFEPYYKRICDIDIISGAWNAYRLLNSMLNIEEWEYDEINHYVTRIKYTNIHYISNGFHSITVGKIRNEKSLLKITEEIDIYPLLEGLEFSGGKFKIDGIDYGKNISLKGYIFSRILKKHIDINKKREM